MGCDLCRRAVEYLKKNQLVNSLVGVREKGINSVYIRNKFMHLYIIYVQFFLTIALPLFPCYFCIHLLAYSVSWVSVCLFVILSCYEYWVLYFTQDFSEHLGCKRTFPKTDIVMSDTSAFLRAY